MRVYINKLPFEIPKNLTEMKNTKEYNQTKLISNEGIFIINNNQIKKLYFDDKNIIEINVNQHDFTCDLSVISKKTWNKIPYDYIVEERKIIEYLDYPKFKIVVEKDKQNKIKELFFETNELENLSDNINTLYFR